MYGDSALCNWLCYYMVANYNGWLAGWLAGERLVV